MAIQPIAPPLNREVQAAPLPVLGRWQIIQKIALQTLIELTLSLSMAALVSSFVPIPMGVPLVFGIALIQCIANLFIRTIGLVAAKKGLENGPRADLFKRISGICSVLAPSGFVFGTAANGQALVHEAGHALAASAVYKGRPKIELIPFVEGVTSYVPEPMTRFGGKLGAQRSLTLVTVSGALLSLSVSSLVLSTSLLIKEKHPTTSQYLLAISLHDFLMHSSYALSALFTPSTKLSHDFVRLSTYGIHPLVAMISILTLPILISTGVKSMQAGRKQPRLA